jgi:hypothetical protein
VVRRVFPISTAVWIGFICYLLGLSIPLVVRDFVAPLGGRSIGLCPFDSSPFAGASNLTALDTHSRDVEVYLSKYSLAFEEKDTSAETCREDRVFYYAV